ncbi:hypothetical protein GGR52DRAFT_535522 [Hypoxylon sp. FL1284]|nr:hypothetical protein GGR52DRAFT_535522 [Hypoxylon sp. FL1284]
MSAQTPPDVDRGTQLRITWWTQFAFASVFICLRVWARTLKRALGFDDAVMVVAWLCFLGDAVAIQFMAQSGGTRHFEYLTADEQQYELKLIQITLTIGIACTGLGKVAVGMSMLRILSSWPSWEKWAIWFVLVITVLASVVDMFLSMFRCGDPRANWDFAVYATAHCIDMKSTTDYNTFTNAWQCLSDFAFSLIPMAAVWKLRMPLRRKIYLLVALGLTLVTGGCAVVKAVLTGSVKLTDLTGGLFLALIWFGTESMLIMVCGSVPMLRPLWERFVKRPPARRGLGYWKSAKKQPSSSQATDTRTNLRDDDDTTVGTEQERSNCSSHIIPADR